MVPAEANRDVPLEPVAVQKADIDTPQTARDAVPKGRFTNRSGDEFSITKSGARKLFSGFNSILKREVAPEIARLAEATVTYAERGDFSYAAGLAELDGKTYAVRAIMRKVTTKDTHLHQIEGVEVPPYFYDPKATVVAAGGRGTHPSVADVVRVFNEIPHGSLPAFQDTRGTIHIPKGDVGKSIIELMQTADASTFVHEAAHFFAALLAHFTQWKG